MKTFELKGTLRTATGKKDSKNLRDQELVPCVLYGGKDNVHFSIPFNEFRHVVYTPEVFLVNLDIEGTQYQAVMQDSQWHPVEEKMLHADFLQVHDNKPVKVSLPVNIQGTAKGIKSGGKLKVNLRKLKVKGIAKNLPDAINVNVSELGLGQSIKVGDLKSEGVQLLNNKSDVIATVTVTRAARAAMSAEKGKK
ncbi:MAG: 50S ribosomal protein L25/general stress protein Ctc [Bacteroidota bacterium]